jgi:pimeloyl-ACP methyl ester carboxylesterase
MRRLRSTLVRWTLVLASGALFVLLAALATLRFTGQLREEDARQAVPPQTGRFVAADDVRLFVQERGPLDGPVIVFTHGAGAWSEAWRSMNEVLAAAGYRCVAIDVPPFGFSDRPRSADYGDVAQARRIAAALKTLGVDRFALVAHSIGSRPAMELALAAPERITAVVLVSAALRLDEGASAEPGLMPRLLLHSAFVREALVAGVATNPRATAFLVSKLVENPLSETDVAMFQRPMVRPGTIEAWGQWASEIALSRAAVASADRRRYSAFLSPTLVLWGQSDRVTPLAQGQQLAQLLPRSIFLSLDGVGHIPQIEDRARVEVLLLTYFKNIVPVERYGSQR